uniref:Uncharacterized protein n=1 Tax=Arundo donax TaxID=35708 RepID=A0A0A9ADQ8_ARUDO
MATSSLLLWFLLYLVEWKKRTRMPTQQNKKEMCVLLVFLLLFVSL